MTSFLGDLQSLLPMKPENRREDFIPSTKRMIITRPYKATLPPLDLGETPAPSAPTAEPDYYEPRAVLLTSDVRVALHDVARERGVGVSALLDQVLRHVLRAHIPSLATDLDAEPTELPAA